MFDESSSARCRTYAYAIAGMPKRMQFDPETSNFSLEYVVDKSISAPTEIYLNSEWYYPSGYTITFVPPTAATYQVIDKNHIAITASSSCPDGSSLVVSIQRRM